MRAAIELHRIGRQLDVDWAKTELRRVTSACWSTDSSRAWAPAKKQRWAINRRLPTFHHRHRDAVSAGLVWAGSDASGSSFNAAIPPLVAVGGVVAVVLRLVFFHTRHWCREIVNSTS